MTAIFQACSFWSGENVLQFAGGHFKRTDPSKIVVGGIPSHFCLACEKALYSIALCCLSTGHERIWTLPLEIPRWFLRAFVSYDWTPVIIGCTCQVRYIWSLCGTEDLINRLILDGLLWLCWRFFEAYILVGTMLFVCWFVVFLFPLVYRPQFYQCHVFTLIWVFLIWLHFSFLCSFLHIEMLALPLSLFLECHLFFTPIISARCFDCGFSGCFGL